MRELDALDLRLLGALQSHGELSPTDLHVQRRLDRLELEGYVLSDSGDPGRSYKLTELGGRALNFH